MSSLQDCWINYQSGVHIIGVMDLEAKLNEVISHLDGFDEDFKTMNTCQKDYQEQRISNERSGQPIGRWWLC